MSQRVFYIVHLDKARIASLAVIVAGLLLTAFATGYRTGNAVDPLPTDRSNIAFNDLNLNETIDPMAERQNDPSADNDQVHSLDQPMTSATDSKEPNSLQNSSIDLLASKEANLKPKQRVNLLDSAIDTTEDNDNYQNSDATAEKISRSSDKKVDDAKKTVKKKPTTKESQTNPKPVKKQKKTTKKEQEKSQVVRKNTKKETEKPEPTTVAKKEPKPDIYLLQMGAYQSREAALRLSDQIRQHGIQTYVRKTGNVHTVRTEAVTNRQQLFQTEKKLKSLRFSPITVMIKENN